MLDSLRGAFPKAAVSHAYASTEAGVAFEVSDGLAGFPADYVERVRDGVEMKVLGRLAAHPLAAHGVALCRRRTAPLADDDGFVDTGDMVELHGDRYVFAGRRGGIINIGGLKVHPEEIEAVINRHPQVRMSLVRPKASPITGSIVIADVVLKSGGEAGAGELNAGQGRYPEALPRSAAAPQGAGRDQHRAGARCRGDRKAGAASWLRNDCAHATF